MNDGEFFIEARTLPMERWDGQVSHLWPLSRGTRYQVRCRFALSHHSLRATEVLRDVRERGWSAAAPYCSNGNLDGIIPPVPVIMR